jgi:hypothetical protein
MLAYWGGLVTSFGDYYVRDDTGTTVGPSDQFPLFSPYSADNATITDRDLNFGMEAAFVPQQCNPLNTLYYTYWKDYIRELYSEDARTLECTVSFDNFDLLQFKWNNKYYKHRPQRAGHGYGQAPESTGCERRLRRYPDRIRRP